MDNSWKILQNGIKFKNNDFSGGGTFGQIESHDIESLGYNKHELYTPFQRNPPSGITIIGYCKLLTNELVAIHRIGDEIEMTSSDIDSYLSDIFTLAEWEEEDKLQKGIEEKGISQSYIESIYNSKAVHNSIDNGKYIFSFQDGWLCSYQSSTGFSAEARQSLDIDDYIQEASMWYNGNMSKIITEINLQATCMYNINYDILRSSVVRQQFSYPNGCCNYIAMAAHYKSQDIDFEDLLNSIHGNYQVIEKNSIVTKIKAYGEIFTKYENVVNKNILQEDLYTTNNSFGYVYVMINPSLPDIVKIGKTTRDPNERAKELSAASGVPTPFIVVYYKPFKDCHLAELVIHKYFEDKGARVNGNREFFKVTTVEAIDMIDLYHKMQ